MFAYISEVSLNVLLEEVDVLSIVICGGCKNYLSVPHLIGEETNAVTLTQFAT